jgi:tetrathionate reductase subunit A
MNKLTRLDEKLFNLPLVEPIGGIPDFSSTRVKIEKI